MGRNKCTNNVLNVQAQYSEIDRLTILFDRRPDLEFKKSVKILIFGEKLPGARFLLGQQCCHQLYQNSNRNVYYKGELSMMVSVPRSV